MPQTLVLLGGAPVGTSPLLDGAVVSTFTSMDVLVLPTAAAYLHPERLVVEMAEALDPFGVRLEALMVLSHREAGEQEIADRIRRASTVWFTGGNALHLRSVLANSAALDALMLAYGHSATVVASGAAASAIVEPMVDPRGGALTLGLGLERGLAVVTHDGSDPEGARLARTVAMAPPEVVVVDLDPDAGVCIRDGAIVATLGSGGVRIYRGGQRIELDEV